MFLAISENLTNLGGPMGTERTYPNWRKYFNTAEAALDYCAEEYGEPLTWINTANGFRSPDLGHVMYRVQKLVPEA